MHFLQIRFRLSLLQFPHLPIGLLHFFSHSFFLCFCFGFSFASFAAFVFFFCFCFAASIFPSLLLAVVLAGCFDASWLSFFVLSFLSSSSLISIVCSKIRFLGLFSLHLMFPFYGLNAFLFLRKYINCHHFLLNYSLLAFFLLHFQ